MDLPVRSRSTGPSDHGHDRLDIDDAAVADGGHPAELRAALSAFDSGRRGIGATRDDGHSNDRGNGHEQHREHEEDESPW